MLLYERLIAHRPRTPGLGGSAAFRDAARPTGGDCLSHHLLPRRRKSATSLKPSSGRQKSTVQRQPPVAPRRCVRGPWHEAVIGKPSGTATSMTGIERAAVLQRGRPPVDPPTRSRMSAARRFELTFSTQSSHGCRWSFPQHKEWRPGIVQVLRVVVLCAAFDAPLSRGVLFTTSTLTAGAGRQKAAETRPTA